MGGDRLEREKPIHEVELDSFWIGQYPVTQVLLEEVMGKNPSYFKGNTRPIERVSWEDTQIFLQKLNKRLGLEGEKSYRLPTEAEWEYAARGGRYSQGYTYAGSEQLNQVGWYWENGQYETHSVGLLLPNELGIFDMSGNVREWCQDWFDENYYEKCHAKGVVKNPKGPESGRRRVLRGGCWFYSASICRVAYRDYGNPSNRNSLRGLRLSRTAL